MTSPFISSSTVGTSTLDGLEFIRLYAPDGTHGNVGIGDFGLIGTDDPSERLDIRTGRLRIRQLPNDAEDQYSKKVMVVDQNGIVGWRNESFYLDATTDCDWEHNAGHDVYTAVATAGTNGSCPEEDNAVGIGTNAPTAKLQVETNDFDVSGYFNGTKSTATGIGLDVHQVGGTTINYGVRVNTVGGGSSTGENTGVRINVGADEGQTYKRTRGVYAETNGASFTAFAGRFDSFDPASYAWGVLGTVNVGSTCAICTGIGVDGASTTNAGNNFGVRGMATATSISSYNYFGLNGVAQAFDAEHGFAHGIHGSASSASGTDDPSDLNGQSVWAGYFEGPVYSTIGFSSSDIKLKKNVNDLKGDQALAFMMRLAPKRYEFNIERYAFMGLPSGTHFGLIAQDVEKVLPELVTRIQRPADYDINGALVHEAVEFKAVDYLGFIPVLVAAVREQEEVIEVQQTQIEALNERLSTLEQKFAGAAGPGSAMGRNDLSISPNPFGNRTTINYTVCCTCRVQLVVTSTDGKPVSTLLDEQRAEGSYTFDWDTTAIAQGMYFCTLLVDGQPVVKQAAKVAR